MPMHIDPALAAQLIMDPDAYARLVGGLDGASFTVNYLHVMSRISVVPGVPTIVHEVVSGCPWEGHFVCHGCHERSHERVGP
jgi:hypothetical protein